MSKLCLQSISYEHPQIILSWKLSKPRFKRVFSNLVVEHWSFGCEFLWARSHHLREGACKISAHFDFVWSSYDLFYLGLTCWKQGVHTKGLFGCHPRLGSDSRQQHPTLGGVDAWRGTFPRVGTKWAPKHRTSTLWVMKMVFLVFLGASPTCPYFRLMFRIS